MFVSQRLAVKVNYASSVVPGAARAISRQSACQIRVAIREAMSGACLRGLHRVVVGFIVDGIAKMYAPSRLSAGKSR